MASIKAIRKEIKKAKQIEQSIQDTAWGSLYCALSVFLPKLRKGTYAYNNMWDRLPPLPYLDDPEFLRKTLDIFGLTYEDVKDLPLVAFHTVGNVLFFPYVKEQNDSITVLPIASDLSFPPSVEKYKDTMEFVDWNILNK